VLICIERERNADGAKGDEKKRGKHLSLPSRLFPAQVTLELGGKSPVLVFDDVDVDKAIPWVALAILFNQGQDCTAGSRLFVQKGIYDTFVKKLVEAFKAHTVGDPFSDETFQGPQVSKVQQEKILGYIEQGKKEGAKVEVGGGVWEGAKGQFAEGYWVAPTIFSGCKKGMKIVDEEIFGPVLAVASFETEEEAVALANDTIYGLGAGIFSENASRCMRLAGEIDAGTVWVNNYALLSNGECLPPPPRPSKGVMVRSDRVCGVHVCSCSLWRHEAVGLWSRARNGRHQGVHAGESCPLQLRRRARVAHSRLIGRSLPLPHIPSSNERQCLSICIPAPPPPKT
jgi:hypothetical protein